MGTGATGAVITKAEATGATDGRSDMSMRARLTLARMLLFGCLALRSLRVTVKM